MRILVGECKQEISSFNPVLSHYEDFTILWGDDLLAFHRGGRGEMAGALGVFAAAPGVQVVPTYGARSRTSAGTLAGPDFERIADEFLGAVRKAARNGPIDGVYYSLHGAMASTDEPDPEGYLLQESRKILGEEVPIVISLDLHAIVTERMMQHVDGMTMFHTYPHVDFYDTGERAARLLLRILSGAKPLTAKVYIPALVRGNELKTETGLLGKFVRQAEAIEREPWGLAAAINIGNPFTDVPELGSNAIVTVDLNAAPDAEQRAKEAALEMARGFWAVREKLQAPLVPLAEAVRVAQESEGTTILTDAADATSSGASGDSNEIIAELLRQGYTKAALAPIVDEPAVQRAMMAGIGATIETTLGGSLDPRFTPLKVAAYVKMLSDGRYRAEYSGNWTDAGPTAVLEIATATGGSITVVATSRSVSLTDRSLFWGHGLDPKRFDAVVVKSPHCRYEYFDEWAARDLNVDAKGSTSANLRSLGHKVVRRPIFPLDAEVPFEPRARVFCRAR
ncbi:MAG: M81 family metallopeptidase [Chloroflexi bacterium]|nr:M81 family metallopeptidase [Chloroflexota bacterium]